MLQDKFSSSWTVFLHIKMLPCALSPMIKNILIFVVKFLRSEGIHGHILRMFHCRTMIWKLKQFRRAMDELCLQFKLSTLAFLAPRYLMPTIMPGK